MHRISVNQKLKQWLTYVYKTNKYKLLLYNLLIIMRQTAFEWMQDNALVWLVIIGVVWITSIIWVARDSIQRTDSVWLYTLYILLVTVFTPLIGIPIYLLIRPMNYIKDRIPRRESMVIKNIPCEKCGMMNLHKHRYCVFCGEKLTCTCKECGKSYPYHYEYCFYCGAPNLQDISDS